MALFDRTVTIKASPAAVWRAMNRSITPQDEVTASQEGSVLVIRRGNTSLVYLLQAQERSDLVNLRHVVTTDVDVGSALQTAEDIPATLDTLPGNLTEANVWEVWAARSRLERIASEVEPQAYQVTTPPSVSGYQVAGLRRRLVASILDSFVLFAFGLCGGLTVGFLGITIRPPTDPTALIVIDVAVYFFYNLYFLTLHDGQTPGKRKMGIRVVKMDGRPISFGTVFLRSTGYHVGGIVLFLGWIEAIIDERHRGWHDRLAGTMVVMDSAHVDSAAARPTSEPSSTALLIRAQTPVATYLLVALNVAIFLVVGSGPAVYQWGASNHRLVFQASEYFRLVTAMFLHADFAHLLFNMLALYIVGRVLERYCGYARFLLIYVLGGLAGSITSVLLNNPDVSSVGASGAVFAVFGGEMIYFYLYRNVLPDADKTLRSALLTIGVNFFNGIRAGSGIDSWAHLGGLVGGVVVTWIVSLLSAVRLDPAHDRLVIVSTHPRVFRIILAASLCLPLVLVATALIPRAPRTVTVHNISLRVPAGLTEATDAEKPDYCDQPAVECLFVAVSGDLPFSRYIELIRLEDSSSGRMSLEQIDERAWSLVQQQMFGTVELISREELEVDGRRAIQRIFTAGTQTHLVLFVADRDSFLRLRAQSGSSSFEKYHDDLDAIIGSIRFVGSSG